MARIFLLSPAHAGGVRAQLLLREQAAFPLAERLRSDEGVQLGEAFQFTSGLYFRGKWRYARTFAAPPARVPGVLVIAPSWGLARPERPVRRDDLVALARVPVDLADERYRAPLERDAAALAAALGERDEVVLLGSIATAKYVDLLLAVFGERLLFPTAFVGRGDLSRGGLLLRAARAGAELDYLPVQGARRRGARPPRLPRLR